VSEVVAKLAERGASRAEIIEGIAALGVAILPFEHADAIEAGMLRPSTRSAGLSFADRACVTLAARLNAHVITADRAFARVELPAPVELFRTPQVQDQ
jgi:PIN domain nuclease of toxin-antitoxin system